MLRGVLITLPDGTQVIGIIFPDEKLYAHEPICDLWASEADFIDLYPDASIELIGPVVATELARKQLTETYEENKRNITRDYKTLMSMYASLDAVAFVDVQPVGAD